MSASKRKSIVFDLDEGKLTKSFKVPRGAIARPERHSKENGLVDNWVSYMQPEILTMNFMIKLLEQVT